MNKTLFTIITYTFISTLSYAQNSAHKTRVTHMQADGRGEVVRTVDDSANTKIWSLQDGKLVSAMKDDSPEWYSKQVRYRFYNTNHGFPLATDLKRKIENPRGTEWDYWKIMEGNSSVIGNIKLPANSVESEDYNRTNGKLVLFGVTKGKASLWMFDRTISTTEAKLFDSYKIEEDQYFNPAWSPKGNYMICTGTHKLWNMNTGKRIDYDKKIIPEGALPFCFSAEEDKVSITTKEGISVVDTQTGKTLANYSIPTELRISGPFKITACADGKSFVYNKQHFLYVTDPENPVYRKVWLITEGKIVTELMD